MAKLDESQLEHTTECDQQDITDYWHEHDECGDPECYAQECLNCGEWQTLCGMSS